MAEPRAIATTAGMYVGPACPRCNVALDVSLLAPGEQICPACSRPFLATPFTPPEPRAEIVASLVEAGPEGGIPCACHAGNAAVANCSRCGIFMCSLCRIEIDGMELCPSCFDRLSTEGVLSSAQTRLRDYQGLALSIGIFGCFLYVFGFLTGPLTFYFAWKAFRQRRALGDRGGAFSLVLSILLGLFQIGLTVFLIWVLVSESTT